MYLFGCCLLIFLSFVNSIPIDNGVEGDPEIECGASAITVSFNTRNNFEGHVYVKGRFAEAGCRSDESGRKSAGIALLFTACGVQRTRSLNPRGIFVSTTVVITFHPQFLTKVDRAYTLQCFYMEADKTVSQELEVSEITTQFQSQVVPMPVCRYDILDGAPTGQPIKFALIGQQVYHKWTCTTETTDIFCMVVHDCFVDDGAGNKALLLNENGCALDRHLLQNLEYTSDLMAGREAHVFKYADKAALFFQCQITITIKEPGQQCPRPQCPEPGGIGGAIISGAGAGSPPRQSTSGPAPPQRPALPAATPGPQNPAPTAGIGVEAPTRRPHKGKPTPAGSGEGAEPGPVSQPPGVAPPGAVTNGYQPTQGQGANPPPTNANPPPAEPASGATASYIPPGSGAPPPGTGAPPPGTGAPPPGTGAPPPVNVGTSPAEPPPATGGPPIPQLPINVPTGTRPPSEPVPAGPYVSGAPQPVATPGPQGTSAPTNVLTVGEAYGTNPPSIPSAVPPQPVSGAPEAHNTNAPVVQSSAAPAPVSNAPAAYNTNAPVVPAEPVSNQPIATAAPASQAPAYGSNAPEPVQQSSTPAKIGNYAGDLPLPLDFELRKKRDARLFRDELGTVDLRAQPIVTFDIDDDSALVHDLQLSNLSAEKSLNFDLKGQVYCLTSLSLGLFLSFVVASALTAVAFCFLFCFRRSNLKQKL